MKKKLVISLIVALSLTGLVYWKLHQGNGQVFGAAQKISELNSLSSPLASDVVPIVDSGSTQQVTLTNLFSLLTGTYPVVKTTNAFSLAFGTTTNNLWSGTNIWQNASSTIVGNLTIGGFANILGNATATNATTTNFFTTTASSTSVFGGGLLTCTTGSFLQWSGGKFACGTPTTAGTIIETVPPPNYRSLTNSTETTFTNSNTSMSCGQIVVPGNMTVNSITVNISAVATRGGTAGQMKFGLYAESGASQTFATTTFISTSGIKTFALTTPTSINQGVYYFCGVPVGTGDFDISTYANTMSTLDQITGKSFLNGTTTVSAGTLPSSFTPSSMGAVPNQGIIVRFD